MKENDIAFGISFQLSIKKSIYRIYLLAIPKIESFNEWMASAVILNKE